MALAKNLYLRKSLIKGSLAKHPSHSIGDHGPFDKCKCVNFATKPKSQKSLETKRNPPHDPTITSIAYILQKTSCAINLDHEISPQTPYYKYLKGAMPIFNVPPNTLYMVRS